MATKGCYQRALKAVRSDAEIASKKLQLIAKLATNPNRFVAAISGAGTRFGLTTMCLVYVHHIETKRFWRSGTPASTLLPGVLRFPI
jgi:hypothetical protein